MTSFKPKYSPLNRVLQQNPYGYFKKSWWAPNFPPPIFPHLPPLNTDQNLPPHFPLPPINLKLSFLKPYFLFSIKTTFPLLYFFFFNSIIRHTIFPTLFHVIKTAPFSCQNINSKCWGQELQKHKSYEKKRKR